MHFLINLIKNETVMGTDEHESIVRDENQLIVHKKPRGP